MRSWPILMNRIGVIDFPSDTLWVIKPDIQLSKFTESMNAYSSFFRSKQLRKKYVYRLVRQQPTMRKAKRKNKRLLPRTTLILIAFPGFYLIFRRGKGVLNAGSYQNRSYIMMLGPFNEIFTEKNFRKCCRKREIRRCFGRPISRNSSLKGCGYRWRMM